MQCEKILFRSVRGKKLASYTVVECVSKELRYPTSPLFCGFEEPSEGSKQQPDFPKGARSNSPGVSREHRRLPGRLHLRSSGTLTAAGSALQIDADTILQVCNQFETTLPRVVQQTDCSFHYSFLVKLYTTGKPPRGLVVRTS